VIIILGLVILVAAVVVGVAGVLSNGGSTHALTHEFAVFGYHVTGSAGTLFLYGIAVGALALFGLSLLLAAARRSSRRARAARSALKQSRRETAAVSQHRDHLIDQRETARTDQRETARTDAVDDRAVGTPRAAPPDDNRPLDPSDTGHGRRHLFGHRSPTQQDEPVGTTQSGR
jgi:uncharacterized membrane protein YciS (DUF1049 family)